MKPFLKNMEPFFDYLREIEKLDYYEAALDIANDYSVAQDKRFQALATLEGLKNAFNFFEQFKTECKALIYKQTPSEDLGMIHANMEFVDTYAIDYYKTHKPKDAVDEWNEEAMENYMDNL